MDYVCNHVVIVVVNLMAGSPLVWVSQLLPSPSLLPEEANKKRKNNLTHTHTHKYISRCVFKSKELGLCSSVLSVFLPHNIRPFQRGRREKATHTKEGERGEVQYLYYIITNTLWSHWNSWRLFDVGELAHSNLFNLNCFNQ